MVFSSKTPQKAPDWNVQTLAVKEMVVILLLVQQAIAPHPLVKMAFSLARSVTIPF
jgi:hypothetical protein